MKHIIITKVLEFGGCNSHLRHLINYLNQSILVILKTKDEQIILKNMQWGLADVLVKNQFLHEHTAYIEGSFTKKFKEAARMIKSILSVFILSLKNNFAPVTISEIDPEKHFYLMWLPFIRVVYVLHSEPDEPASNFTSLSCNFLLGARKKIITVSESNKDKLIRNWRISARASQNIHVIYNTAGCISNSIKNIKSLSAQKLVLTLAHVVHYKNPEVWLEVAKRVTALRSDVYFIWLGNGELFNYYKTRGAGNDQIKFAGFVPNPAVYLEKASIYYQPSLKESQGIGVLEAMASGLPCVVSNVGGLPESVLNDYNGFVLEPNNIEKQVAAILKLADDPKLCKDFGLRSAARYEQLFSIERFSLKMNSVYNRS